jgi:hypothetical protein
MAVAVCIVGLMTKMRGRETTCGDAPCFPRSHGLSANRRITKMHRSTRS